MTGTPLTINLRVIAIAVAVCLGMLVAIQAASPESLGISPIAARWLGIIGGGLGVLQSFLPKVQGPSNDPDFIAERIKTMTSEQRRQVLAIIDPVIREDAA